MKRNLFGKKNKIKAQLQKLAEESNRFDSLQYARDKLINSTDSVWFGSDLLYIVRIEKKNKSNNDDQSILDRLLSIVRKKDAANSVHLIYVIIKGNEVEVKNSWDIRTIRSIDYGDDNNELVLSYDATDFNWRLANTVDRDEAAWILIQSCKQFCATDPNIGYGIDLDSIGYSIITNGTLDRFPLLQKLGAGLILGTDTFSGEETEALALLEELQWTSNISAHVDIQKSLATQADNLSMEIIDFLLQWEDDSAALTTTPSLGVSSKDLKKPRKSTVESEDIKRLKDTSGVLSALTSVEQELQAVDDWIVTQLKKLGMVQSKLTVIQRESGMLENTWQNLSNLKGVIEILVELLDISDEEEKYIRNPNRVIDESLRDADLSNVYTILSPLVDALVKLQTAIAVKPGHPRLTMINSSQWKQLQTVAAISLTKQRLADMANNYCHALTESISHLMESLLKHKALHTPNRNLEIKQFKFNALIEGIKVVPAAAGRARSGTNVSSASIDSNDDKTDHHNGLMMLQLASDAHYRDHNQALQAQTHFHLVLSDYLPLFDAVNVLDYSRSLAIHSAYVNVVQEKLYKPMFKTMFKDIDEIVARPALLTYSNLAACPAPTASTPLPTSNTPLKFLPQKTGKKEDKIPAWIGLASLFLMIFPVLRKEDLFFRSLLSGGNSDDQNPAIASEIESRAEAMLNLLFDSIPKRLEKYINIHNTNVDIDGFEAMGFFTVVEAYRSAVMGVRTDTSTDMDEDSTHPLLKDDYSSFCSKVLDELKASLLKRIEAFMGEQCNWIAHQKGDPKKANLLPIVSKFPSFLFQINELAGFHVFECIETLVYQVAKEVFNHIETVAASNDKYVDVVRVRNYTYLLKVIPTNSNIKSLEKFIQFASKEVTDSHKKYIKWMLEYEFPALSDLMQRLDDIRSRVKDEELSVYIRRKDVIAVTKDLDKKKVEELVINMKKRLEKHFSCPDDVNLGIPRQLWMMLKEKMVAILGRLEECAVSSYQLALDVDGAYVSALFDKTM